MVMKMMILMRSIKNGAIKKVMVNMALLLFSAVLFSFSLSDISGAQEWQDSATNQQGGSYTDTDSAISSQPENAANNRVAGNSNSGMNNGLGNIDFDGMLKKKGSDKKSPSVEELKKKIAKEEKNPFSPDKIPSLFFTYWQHEAILDAKKARGRARPPGQSEFNGFDDEEKVKPKNRDVSLSGIVYVNPNDWTIWLNGKRVTPHAIPEEIMDIQVYKEYIEVKWLDEYTNQIFPIRLRAHQRFNLDTRIFLPG